MCKAWSRGPTKLPAVVRSPLTEDAGRGMGVGMGSSGRLHRFHLGLWELGCLMTARCSVPEELDLCLKLGGRCGCELGAYL